MDFLMEKKSMVALLLLLVVVGQQICCCKHAIKIEKIVQERRCFCIVDDEKIH